LRPRISQKEAAYLAEFLQLQLEPLLAEQQRGKELESELWQLKAKLKDLYCSTTQKLAEIEAYKETEAELAILQKRRFKVYKTVELHKRLIEKYQSIASGNSHRGDYKRFNSGIAFSL
jgi:DNA repair exonuclease SbcCD ATPase subunit